jgi:hypothetical protein
VQFGLGAANAGVAIAISVLNDYLWEPARPPLNALGPRRSAASPGWIGRVSVSMPVGGTG